MIRLDAAGRLNRDQVAGGVGTMCATDASDFNRPHCPRCGGTNLSVCGESVQYRREERPNQPLSEREVRTIAYQCECGLGFTESGKGDLEIDESA
jgi:hypothetical protein